MKKKAQIKAYKLRQTLKHTSRSGNKRNSIKCWSGISYEHFRVMSDIVFKLVQQGYECYTESEFNTGGRGDIIAISPSGDGYIIEVLHSETDEYFKTKLNKYPKEFTIIKVRTHNFDINSFDL